MFTNSRYRMHGVSLHNVCIVYNMNGCVPILYVCCVVVKYDLRLYWYCILMLSMMFKPMSYY
jgi:hypothetical protein